MKIGQLGLGAVVALAVSVTGCDPCSGIADCEGQPRVAFEGQIVTSVDGIPVQGAQVELLEPGGVAGTAPSSTAITDAGGNFSVALRVEEEGPTTLDVIVTPPDHPAYRIRNLPVRALTRRGEGYVSEPWVDRPYFPCAGEAWPVETPTGAVRLANERMEFHQTAGTPLAERNGSPVTMTTDSYGRFPLLGRHVPAGDLAPIRGDVALVRGSTRLWARGVALEPTYLARPAPAVCVLIFGNHFRYLGQAVIDGRPVNGVTVTFRRVGGVQGAPSTFTQTTAGWGFFTFEGFRPAGPGVVIFELTFNSPALAAPITTRDTLPVLETWSPGEQYSAYHLDRPDSLRGPVLPYQ